MQEYDLYLNPQKPTLGLYVRTGAGVSDLADADRWVFDSTLAGNELSSELVQGSTPMVMPSRSWTDSQVRADPRTSHFTVVDYGYSHEPWRPRGYNLRRRRA
jgi:hypothetical protein